jgi:hypothetical protein
MALTAEEMSLLKQYDNEIDELNKQRLADLIRKRAELLEKSNNGTSPAISKKTAPAMESKTPPPAAQKLLDFLKANGPISRGVIIEKSGMPRGTIAYLLTTFKKRLFKRKSDGRWEAIQE